MSSPIPPAQAAAVPPASITPTPREPSGDDGAAFEQLMSRRFDDSKPPSGDSEDTDGDSDDNESGSKLKDAKVGDLALTSDDVSGPSTTDAAIAWQPAHTFQGFAPAPLVTSSVAPAEQAPAWAQISAHVERMLVEAGGKAGNGPAAVMTLKADLLVDTSMCLTRVAEGWSLRIESRDRRLLTDADTHEAALRELFAARGLGALTIEHGAMPWSGA